MLSLQQMRSSVAQLTRYAFELNPAAHAPNRAVIVRIFCAVFSASMKAKCRAWHCAPLELLQLRIIPTIRYFAIANR